MSSRSSRPAHRPVTVALCLMALCFAAAVLCAATASAANYKVLFCAAGNGAGGPTLGAKPGGFDFTNHCGTAYGDPPGNGGWLRLEENGAGTAGQGDEASYSWGVPPWVSIRAAGAYTRTPHEFNEGWRLRFSAEDWGGGEHNILIQGAGVANGSLGGIGWARTSTFASHLWPFDVYGDYRRFTYALSCYRPAGCSRSGHNAADANAFALILDDKRSPEVGFIDGETVRGGWVRGEKAISWREHDDGSGLRLSRLKVDGATLGTIDYQANGGCRTGNSDSNGEFATAMDPCTRGPYQRWYGLDTEELADGSHELAICLKDYGQHRSGGESCDARTIRTDNSAPGRPASLELTSANPERYLPDLGATFALPPNHGSPIARVHYEILDAAGRAVTPHQTASATDPTSVSGIEAPKAPGAYTLRLWLEDEVGHAGPAATAPIPRDTTPPAAPQELRVIAPSAERRAERFALRWRNLSDAGSPVIAARHRIVDAEGNALTPTRSTAAANVQAVEGLATPAPHRDYSAQVWLVDAEGNVGAAASVPLPRDTAPPAAPQRLSVASPDSPRAQEGFDVRWHNLPDGGSPIAAAHYEVRDAAGRVVVSTETVSGPGIEAIADLRAPRGRGAHTLRLWLSDAEGNVGAPASVPLAYSCVRSGVGGGAALSAGLGRGARERIVVGQGRGAALRGRLGDGRGAGVANAPVCVFARVVTDRDPEFLGIALTDAEGRYRFAVPAGPSRQMRVLYRPDQRRLSAEANLYTRVRPLLRVARRVARNKGGRARFAVRVPGPANDRVVVVLQVRQGKGWRAFRRCRTRNGGRCRVSYRFGRTSAPATYAIRAQVRRQGGYPYLPGNSRPVRVQVIP